MHSSLYHWVVLCASLNPKHAVSKHLRKPAVVRDQTLGNASVVASLWVRHAVERLERCDHAASAKRLRK
jgi:hypothetical protein